MNQKGKIMNHALFHALSAAKQAAVGALVVFFACSASAYTWTGNAGNLLLTDAENWDSPSSDNKYMVKKYPGGALKIGSDDFFGGAMLRYGGNGTFAVTNDFGAEGELANVGKLTAASSLHVENGDTLVQKSGGIHAWSDMYISDGAHLILDGPSSWLTLEKCLKMRNQTSATAPPEYPDVFVTNGALLTVKGTLSIGFGGFNVAARVSAGGAGSRITANTIEIGYASPQMALTNTLVVADSAVVNCDTAILGRTSSSSELYVDGGIFTVSNTFTIGSYQANIVSNTVLQITSGGVFTNLTATTTFGLGNKMNTSRVRVAGAGSSYVGTSNTTIYDSIFSVEDGGSVEMGKLTVKDCDFDVDGGSARMGETALRDTSFRVADGGSAEMGKTTFSNGVFSVENGGKVRQSGDFLVYDSRIETGGAGSVFGAGSAKIHSLNVEGVFDYGTIYMDYDGGEFVCSNAVVTGSRIQMTNPCAIRLHNTHLSITNNYLMLGDGGSSDAAIKAYPRDIYVSGTDTWVRVVNSGVSMYIRGTNTTIHIDIPAEGLSADHPVFDLPKIGTENNAPPVRVVVSADTRLMAKGGTYTLFRTADNTCQQDDRLQWIYDPKMMQIDKSVANEVRVRVKRCGFLVMFK